MSVLVLSAGGRWRRRAAVVLLLCAPILTSPRLSRGAEPSNESSPGRIDFAAQIEPLLTSRCLACHGPDAQEGSLRLDSQAELLRGGASGPVVVPGDAAASPLLERVTADDPEQRMPLGRAPLVESEIDLLRRWIEQGADWPVRREAAVAGSQHWSFQPLRPVGPPAVQHTSWTANAIDHFVLARLESLGVAPSAEASQYTLIRRLSLDLTGLPPEPDEILAFLADRRPRAYERLVDRLLASPHFGERFGNHWLDLARYGDSDGYEQDAQRPNAYRFRDWTINSFNADQPYDQFTIEQLAGDLLPDASPRQIMATGFHRHSPTNREGGIDREEARVRAIVDRVNTVGTVWLGLTVGCAECHSHKFDPLRQTEYYQLFAFFNDNVDDTELPVDPTPADVVQHQQSQRAYEVRLEELRDRLGRAAAEDRERLQRSLRRLEQRGPPRLQAVVAALGKARGPRQTHVYQGGDYRRRGVLVQPGTPQVFPPMAQKESYDRLDLARWIVSPENPLTARVEANRIWGQLFGTGLVSTPEDFGTQGEPPTHPELLDYLASQLIQGGWSRKELIRQIVCSATYRQSSAHRPEVRERDAENRWLARQNRIRLDAEIVRDVYLSAAGLLDRRIGGPGMRPPLPDGFDDFGYRFDWTTDEAPARYRRGMYIFFQRNMVYPMLRTFDRSDTNVTCVRRERSNTPLQALTLLNDPEVIDAVRAMAWRWLKAGAQSGSVRLERAFLAGLGRPPLDEERALLVDLGSQLHDYYDRHPEAAATLIGSPQFDVPVSLAETAAWLATCRVLVNADEFITRE